MTENPSTFWYGAIAFEGEGIWHVALGSREFLDLYPEMDKNLAAWSHLNGVVRPSLDEIARQVETADFVKKHSGFPPKALFDYAHRLTGIYQGQSWGPFPFEVTWVKR